MGAAETKELALSELLAPSESTESLGVCRKVETGRDTARSVLPVGCGEFISTVRAVGFGT